MMTIPLDRNKPAVEQFFKKQGERPQSKEKQVKLILVKLGSKTGHSIQIIQETGNWDSKRAQNIYLNCSRLLRPHAIDAIYAYACTHCRPIFQLHSDQNYLSLRQLERQSPVTTFLGRGVSVPLTHSRVFYAFPYIFAVGPKRA